MLGQSQVPIFAFLIVKIVAWEQLCQQLVKPVVRMCFCFSIYKNRNVETAMPAIGWAGCIYVFLLFCL